MSELTPTTVLPPEVGEGNRTQYLSTGQETNQTNPYVGPRALRPGEPIYGRARELFELRNLLIAERIVLLYSPSGAGKTSLIQAGLLPEMVKEEFDVLPIMRVGKNPPAGARNRYVTSALRCLEENLSADVEPLSASELGALSLASYLDMRKETLRWESTLLIFDQFEEILTTDPLDDESKVEFFSQVGAVLRDSGRWALFSLREQHLAALDPYTRALPTRLKSTLRLDLLTQESAREAIEKPAAARNVRFTPEAAVRLVDDLRQVTVQSRDGTHELRLGRYIEPVQLQVVCFRLWEKARPNLHEIGAGDIAATGDVNSALGEYYAERIKKIARESGQKEKTLREWFDRSLITDAGLRSEVMKGEGASKEISETAIEQLQAAHLIRSEERPGATWLELSHDRLVRPIRADNTRWFQSHLSLLQQQATSWQRQNRNEALCLRGEALREARQWAKDHRGELTKTDEEFLTASAKEERVRSVQRIRQWAIAASLVVLVTTALAVAAVVGWKKAFAESKVAHQQTTIASARGLASVAYRLFDERLDRAMLLAYEAVQRKDVAETQATLLAATLVNPRLLAFLHGQQSPVGAVAFTHDGEQLAAGDYDGNVVLWNVGTHRPTRAFAKIFPDRADLSPPESVAVRSVAFSRDGKYMAASGADGSIVLRDLTNDTQAPLPLPTVNDLTNMWCVAFNRDSSLLATSDSTGRIMTIDLATRVATVVWTPPAAVPDKLKESRAVAFSDSGSFLAAGTSNGDVLVWRRNQDAWELIDQFSGAEAPDADRQRRGPRIASVCFDPKDENLLASGSWDWTVNVRDVARKQNLAQGRHCGRVSSLAFSPDGKILVTAAQDGTLRLWKTPKAALVPESGVPIPPPGFSQTRPLEDSGRLSGHVGAILAVAFRPDTNMIASGGMDSQAILWDVEHAAEGQNYTDTTTAEFVLKMSPDGRSVAAGYKDGRVILRNRETGAETEVLRHPGAVLALGFSRDGQRVMSASSGDKSGAVVISNLASPGAASIAISVDQKINFAALSPDGRLAATAAGSGEIELWNTQTGERQEPRLGRLDAIVYAIAFSPNGERLAAGGSNQCPRVWQIATGQRVDLSKKHNGSVRAIAFSPDGKTLASAGGDNTVLISNAETGQQLSPLMTAHRGPVVALAFSADGKRLASGSEDKAVVLWNLNNLNNRQQSSPRLLRHADAVRELQFNSDASRLVSLSSPGDAFEWNLEKSSLPARSRARANRNLTEMEWNAYIKERSIPQDFH